MLFISAFLLAINSPGNLLHTKKMNEIIMLNLVSVLSSCYHLCDPNDSSIVSRFIISLQLDLNVPQFDVLEMVTQTLYS